MATKKKLLQAAAGTAAASGGAGGLNVEDVFSTYLYEGNGSTQTITNGIDLAGEGGLVWLKNRTQAYSNMLYDTERGVGKSLDTDNYFNVEQTGRTGLTSFNSNGFSLGNYTYENANGADYASWTWRKAPKFFDVVTYTGTGSAQNISHNLGTTVGTIIVKRTDNIADWAVYHRSTSATDVLTLNSTAAASTDGSRWNNTEPTSTVFTVGSDVTTNENTRTYVAYLFAHNDGDGGFGDGTQDIIKCGSYTEPASGSQTINLGFEPQFILIKSASVVGQWQILDTMRGITDNQFTRLEPNSSGAESTLTSGYVYPLSNGFNAPSGFYGSGAEIIYIAIRRGPMAVPTDATEVFDVQTYTGNGTANRKFTTGFAIDTNLILQRGGGLGGMGSRLIDGMHMTSSDAVVHDSLSDWIDYDYNDGFELETSYGQSNSNGDNYVTYSWQRRPNYFDVVAYTGDGVAGRTVSHNLGVAPEMMWVKGRDVADEWHIYHSGIDRDGDGLPETDYAIFSTAQPTDSVTIWNDTAPTDSVFTLGTNGGVNGSGSNYIAYLFASLDGVSKVGSFTSDGTNLTIDCGFSSGARFILLKDTSALGAWFVWDSERGIVAGNDPSLKLNDTAAENTSNDFVDPDSSGFIVNSSFTYTGKLWIFYAIA